MKKLLFALLLMCIVLVSCTPNNSSSSSSLPTSSTSQPEPQPLEVPVAIEVEHDLDYWWDNYLGDMVYLIQGAYPSSQAAEQTIILEYCTTRYARDNKLDQNPNKEVEATIPITELPKYAKRYFGINDIDRYYWGNTAKVDNSYSIYCSALMSNPSENVLTEWYPFKLISAEKSDEVGVINLKLGSRALNPEEHERFPGGYILYRNFEMVHSGNDQYYLRAVTETQVETVGDTSITYSGEYTKLPLINNQQPYSLILSIVGDRIINQTMGPGTFSLTSVDAKTGGDARQLYPIFTEGDLLTLEAVIGDNFVLGTRSLFYVVNSKLETVTRQELPEEVKSLYSLDFKGEKYDISYSVSPKLDQIAIDDHEGIKVYDFTTKKLTTLVEYDLRAMEARNEYRSGPIFSPDGEHIIIRENSKTSKLVVFKASDFSRLEIKLPSLESREFYSMGTVFAVEQLSQPMTKGNHMITAYDLATGEKLGANKFRSELATDFVPMPDGRLLMRTTALVSGVRTHSYYVIEPVTGTVTDTNFKITTRDIISANSVLVNGETAIIQVVAPWFGAESMNASVKLPK